MFGVGAHQHAPIARVEQLIAGDGVVVGILKEQSVSLRPPHDVVVDQVVVAELQTHSVRSAEKDLVPLDGAIAAVVKEHGFGHAALQDASRHGNAHGIVDHDAARTAIADAAVLHGHQIAGAELHAHSLQVTDAHPCDPGVGTVVKDQSVVTSLDVLVRVPVDAQISYHHAVAVRGAQDGHRPVQVVLDLEHRSRARPHDGHVGPGDVYSAAEDEGPLPQVNGTALVRQRADRRVDQVLIVLPVANEVGVLVVDGIVRGHHEAG